MDDLDGLDRADRWLNSRQGISRSILTWFQVFVPGFFIGLLGWFSWQFFASSSLIVVAAIALAAAVLAVPLRGLAPAMYARRFRRHPRTTGPQFSWSWLALACGLAIDEVLGAVDLSVGQTLPRGLRGAFDLVRLIVSVAVIAIVIMMTRHRKRRTQDY